MSFFIFLWNIFARLVGFFSFIALEIIVFSLVVGAVGAVMPGLASLLTVVFTIWIIIDIVLRIFVGGGKSLIKYIFNF